jgi:fructokinase
MVKSRRVYCIGETVLDIIFREGIPVAAKPGGSMLNSAVSLGRAGVPVHLISDIGQDQAGDIILDFLAQNQVDTTYIERFNVGQTALSLAFLNTNKDAEYTFYKSFPNERLKSPFPSLSPDDIILFGSFYSVTGSIREKLKRFIQDARSLGLFILYDPNFRKSHLRELDNVRPWIIENIGMASMVRGSDEDFQLIFNAGTAEQAFNHVSDAGCPVLVYTKNSSFFEGDCSSGKSLAGRSWSADGSRRRAQTSSGSGR